MAGLRDQHRQRGPLAEEFGAASIESFEADADVTEDGILTSIVADWEFVPQDDDRLFRMENEIETTDVGGTTVEQPSWVSEARERAPRLEATLLEERDCIEVVHEGGDSLPPDAALGVGSPEIDWSQTPLDREFAPGETLYASVVDGVPRVDWSDPFAGDVDPMDRPVTIRLGFQGSAFLRTEL